MMYIISGAPCSGKSTYIKEHKKACDFVIDFDLIYQAITMNELYDKPNHLHEIVEDVRRLLFEKANDFKYDVWASSSKKDFSFFKGRYNFQVIEMDTSYNECLRRLSKDDRRDFNKWQPIIKRWFKK